MTVHSYLVTGSEDQKWDAWLPTASYANWIEGRENGDRETWLVTCFDDSRAAFLTAAKDAGVTVEEIEGAGDDESYKLLVGEPGTGWNASASR